MHIAIGQLSLRTGVNIETIRYYERIGLMPKARRAHNGRRLYGDLDVGRLAFVRHARDLGFDMPVIRALLALQQDPNASCEEIAHIAREQLATIHDRMTRLAVLRTELARIMKACAGGRVAECRIIEALSRPVRAKVRRDTSSAQPRGQAR
jgi:DNA-binding transcriptional MerR regulator